MTSDNGNSLIATFIHPLRGRAWALITDSPGLSAQEVADQLGEPVGRVRYHLREMRKTGVIELVDENLRRGVVEHVYGSALPPVVLDPVFAELDAEVKLMIAIRVSSVVFADVDLAIRSRSFQADHHLTRVPMHVDPQGWDELMEIHLKAWKETERVKTESRERLAARAVDSIPVSAVLMCFQRPSPGG